MKHFSNQSIGRLLEQHWISRSKQTSQNRMQQQLNTLRSCGCVVEHFEDYGVKKIVMRSPDGNLVIIQE